MQKNGVAWTALGDEVCTPGDTAVHWQIHINKDGLILFTLCLSFMSMNEQTQENVPTNTSAKGFSYQELYCPYLTCWFLVCFQKEVSKSAGDSMFLLFSS